MNLRFMTTGAGANLYYIETGRKIDLGAWLEKLKRDNKKEADKVRVNLDLLANRGREGKARKFRPVGDDLYELKTFGGSRVLFFFDGNNVIICATAFSKPSHKVQSQEIERGRERMRQYFEAKEHGEIVYLTYGGVSS